MFIICAAPRKSTLNATASAQAGTVALITTRNKERIES